jgi:hypothetical protein
MITVVSTHKRIQIIAMRLKNAYKYRIHILLAIMPVLVKSNEVKVILINVVQYSLNALIAV